MTIRSSTSAAVPKLSLKEALKLFTWFLKEYRRQTYIALILLLFASLLEGIGVLTLLPLVVILFDDKTGPKGELEQRILDIVSNSGIPLGIEVFLIVFVLAITMKAILIIAAASQVGYGRAQLAQDLRKNLIQALMNARWEYFADQPAGAVANTMNQEAQRGSITYRTTLDLCVNFFQIAIYAALAMLVSVKASIIAIFLGIIIYFIVRDLIRKSRSAAYNERDSLRNLLTRLVDGLALIKPLKAMGLEKYLSPVLEHEIDVVKNAQRRQIFLAQTTSAVNEPLLALFLSIGLYLATNFGNMDLPQILFLAFLVHRIMTRMGVLHVLVQQLAVNEPALAFIRNAIADAANAREIRNEGVRPSFEKSIRLEEISFSYADQTTIDKISLTIPAGKFVAIIGPSGAGKTTILDLITGLLLPNSGRILIDNCSLDELDTKHWRQQIGYVPQETFLYHDTIANNISLGDQSILESDIESALRSADAMDFVIRRKQGLNEIVGERGAKFSNGQRQRLAIARAIIRRPKLLILDEPTSGLDADTETAVLRTLGNLTNQMTILAISHQPGVIRAADIVYHLQNGRIVDNVMGTTDSGGT